MNKLFILSLLLQTATFVISPNIDAELTSYSVTSQFENKSNLSNYLFKHNKEFTKYYKKENNIFVFSNDESTSNLLKHVANKSYKQIAHDLNLNIIKRDDIEVVIFVINNHLWTKLGLPVDVSAFYYKSFNEIYVRIHGNENDVFVSLIHEMTHLVIDNMDRKVPLWFEEGLSQYEPQIYENKKNLKKTTYYTKYELKKIANENDLDLERLVNVYDYSYSNKKLFYELSYQLIKFIHTTGSLKRFSYLYLIKGVDLLSSLSQSTDYVSKVTI